MDGQKHPSQSAPNQNADICTQSIGKKNIYNISSRKWKGDLRRTILPQQ